jgi:hypothetical protein
MSLSTIAAIGVVALIVGLYIVVQRLDRIISLQNVQRELQIEQRGAQETQKNVLIHIADLLEVPYREELDRKEERWRSEKGIPVPKPHASRLQRPPQE